MSQRLKWVVSPQVLTQQVGEELVLLDLAGEAYFGLDSVGTRVWQLLAGGQSVGEIVQVVSQEYEVSEQNAEDDICRLIDELASHHLLMPNE